MIHHFIQSPYAICPTLIQRSKARRLLFVGRVLSLNHCVAVQLHDYIDLCDVTGALGRQFRPWPMSVSLVVEGLRGFRNGPYPTFVASMSWCSDSLLWFAEDWQRPKKMTLLSKTWTRPVLIGFLSPSNIIIYVIWKRQFWQLLCEFPLSVDIRTSPNTVVTVL